MSRDHAVSLPDRLSKPGRLALPAVLVVLLVLSAVALSTGREAFGVVGVVALAVLSLSYGAVFRPEEVV